MLLTKREALEQVLGPIPLVRAQEKIKFGNTFAATSLKLVPNNTPPHPSPPKKKTKKPKNQKKAIKKSFQKNKIQKKKKNAIEKKGFFSNYMKMGLDL